MKVLIVLLITESHAAEVTNVVPGIFSKKVVGNGLTYQLLTPSHPLLPSLLQCTLINAIPSFSTINLHFYQQDFSKLMVKAADIHTLVNNNIKTPLNFGWLT